MALGYRVKPKRDRDNNNFRAVQGIEVLNPLSLTDEEMHNASSYSGGKYYLLKLVIRSKSFFYHSVELMLLELPQSSKIRLIVIHIT